LVEPKGRPPLVSRGKARTISAEKEFSPKPPVWKAEPHAHELLGGNGILLDNHIGRFVADAEAIYSYEGTREINTLIVEKAITGLSAFV
jgi:hypothetical protein